MKIIYDLYIKTYSLDGRVSFRHCYFEHKEQAFIVKRELDNTFVQMIKDGVIADFVITESEVY